VHDIILQLVLHYIPSLWKACSIPYLAGFPWLVLWGYWHRGTLGMFCHFLWFLVMHRYHFYQLIWYWYFLGENWPIWILNHWGMMYKKQPVSLMKQLTYNTLLLLDCYNYHVHLCYSYTEFCDTYILYTLNNMYGHNHHIRLQWIFCGSLTHLTVLMTIITGFFKVIDSSVKVHSNRHAWWIN